MLRHEAGREQQFCRCCRRQKKKKKLSLLSWIIATFTFEVFLHIVECIVTVQEMVEYITLHMGSANNYYPEVFLDVFLFFVFHLLTWTTLFFSVSEAICDGSVGKDQSCFGKKKKKVKILVSMICKCRRILCFCFFLIHFFLLLFSIYLENQKEKKLKKKIWAYPRRKAVYLVISCQVHLYRVQFSFPWVCCDELL